MENRLLIAVTPRHTEVYSSDASYNIEAYFEYLRKPGIPVLPLSLPLCNDADAAFSAAVFDGLLITGGSDISPLLYGAEQEEKTVCDPERYDRSDISLYRAFSAAGKPVLGICRGIQLINAAEGGTLIQDIPSAIGSEHNQRNIPESDLVNGTAHPVSFVPGTVLYGLFGKRSRINSFHHQAVDTPADAFQVSAYAPDGIIEAIEKDRTLAVQWHPERMLNDSAQISLAAYFINQCAELHK